MRTIALLILLISWAWAAEPQPPRIVALNPAVITDVTLSEKVTTIMLFPEEVTMVAGTGLTDGKTPGIVQYDHPPGSRTVALKSLGKAGRTLVQVLTGGEVYAFRLAEGEQPDSVLRLTKATEEKRTQSILKSPFQASSAQIEAVLLASCRAFVGEPPIAGSPGLEWRQTDYSKISGEIEVTVEKIARSAKDDVIVIAGKVRNGSQEEYHCGSRSAFLVVGESRRVQSYKFRTDVETIGAGGVSEFFLVAAGDGEGFRGNFSIRNRFDIILAPYGNSTGSAAVNNNQPEEP